MRLLADENTHGAIVRWLRDRGHDVLWIAEDRTGIGDPAVLELAERDLRFLLTADLDFGDLVFHRQMVSTGIILLRLEALPIAERLAWLAARWPDLQKHAPGHFVVVSPHRMRIRPLQVR